jgi:hypothetical protein
MAEQVATAEKPWSWPSALGLGFLAMVLGMLVGFIPQFVWAKLVSPPYSNTGFVVDLPVGFLLASFGIGYIGVAKFDASRAACYAWVVGVCWLCFGLIGSDGAWSWSPGWTRLSRWDYAFSQMFAFPHGCGETECLGTLVYTAPAFCTIGFSLGAWRAAKREAGRIEVRL